MNKVFFGDCRDSLKEMAKDDVRVQMCVTSPPYFGLRDYGHDGQVGLEETPDEYVAAMVEVFRAVRDVLADDGTLWLNIGDTYAANRGYQVPSTKGGAKHAPAQGFENSGMKVPPGMKAKDLIGIPWMLAFALRSDGWYLRQDIIWNKPNAMPQSVRDRCNSSHEHIFLLSKRGKYFFDHLAIQERAANDNDGQAMRNKRDVWSVNTKGYKGAHDAVFPPALIEPCILAGSRPGDIVLDPFMGSGTTAAVAVQHGRQYIGCELNPAYEPLQIERIGKAANDNQPKEEAAA
jgi:DNA modification methylase